MALIKAGTYRFNGLLDSCGYSAYFEESIQFYNTIPFLVDEEYSALIKAETGFDLATGTYYLKRRCGGFRLSFTAGERYKNWVDYTQVYPVSATPFVPDELLALLPQGIDDIMYDSYAYPYDYYTDVNVWDEEGGNIVTIPEDSEVSEEFGVWFAANAKPLSAIVIYNGKNITTLIRGETATLKCEGMTMESDVVIVTGDAIAP